MNKIQRFLSVLPLLFAAAASHAAPAGTVTQLSGWAMAVKPDGRARVVMLQSKVEAGETLVSETDSFVRLTLDDGNAAVMGPSTSLKIERYSPTDTALSLAAGSLQVLGAPLGSARRLTIEADGTTIDGGTASFLVVVVPAAPGTAVALRQAYVRSSMAALSSAVLSDAGSDLGELVAQLNTAPKPPGLPAGLYVSVIDGAINLSNKGGSTSFTAGQFGYTANITKPPIVVPANPGLKFTPPPTFSSTSAPGSSSSGNKAAAIDCVVR